MDRFGSANSILFEGFRLDRRGGCLFQLDREGVGAPVALGSRALDLLGLLADIRRLEWFERGKLLRSFGPTLEGLHYTGAGGAI